MPTPIAASRRLEYNVAVDWRSLPSQVNTLVGVNSDTEELCFRREKNSHRGIFRLTHLRKLAASCVNQEFLEEISQLPLLESLYIDQTSATSADCLGRCQKLRHLVIAGGTKFPSLSWLQVLPPLDSLRLVNFKQITDLSPLGALASLRAFGMEGMWTTQRVDSFRPLTMLPRLEALFLANCRPVADGLEPLHRLTQLRYLEIAAFYPDAEFLRLRSALPELECHWFQDIDQYGSIKAAIKATVQAIPTH